MKIKNCKLNIFREKGFTIIEMIVVIAISVILTSTLIVYSRSSEAEVVFFKEQSLLVGALLRAKAYSIQTFQPGIQVSPGFPVDTSNLPKICAWGIHIPPEGDRYIIFHDIPQVAGGLCDGAFTPNSSPLEEFETVTFDPRVNILCDLLSSTPGATCSTGRLPLFDVLFAPPGPTVTFSSSDPSTMEAVIVLQVVRTGETRTIRINRGGQVNID